MNNDWVEVANDETRPRKRQRNDEDKQINLMEEYLHLFQSVIVKGDSNPHNQILLLKMIPVGTEYDELRNYITEKISQESPWTPERILSNFMVFITMLNIYAMFFV